MQPDDYPVSLRTSIREARDAAVAIKEINQQFQQFMSEVRGAITGLVAFTDEVRRNLSNAQVRLRSLVFSVSRSDRALRAQQSVQQIEFILAPISGPVDEILGLAYCFRVASVCALALPRASTMFDVRRADLPQHEEGRVPEHSVRTLAVRAVAGA